jgi:hypothetical protein
MSNSKMTVADLSEILADYVPPSFTFLQALNQVQGRFYDAGYYKDMTAKVVFDNGTSTGIISLPRRYGSLLGVSTERGAPLPIYGQYNQWKELSVGYYHPNEYTDAGVTDMGDGYPITTDITTEGVLRWTIASAGDATKSIRLFGTSGGNVIFNSSGEEGITLNTANPTADTTQTFDNVTGVQIPDTMVGRSTLSVVNGGVATTLATYEPGETRPSYRRYKTGVIETDIIGYCSLRFIPYRDDTDWVVPANVGAIKTGFQALVKEDAMNYDEAAKLWGYAIRLLNLQLKAFRGAAKPSLPSIGRPELMSSPRSVY